MTTYIITWTIDIDADTPIDAANQAKEIQRDPDSTANFFSVYNPKTQSVTSIDLDHGCPDCGSVNIIPNLNTEGYMECNTCGSEWKE